MKTSTISSKLLAPRHASGGTVTLCREIMMRELRGLRIAAVGALLCAAQIIAGAEEVPHVLHVRIPGNMPTETLLIGYGVYLDGGIQVGHIQGRAGVFEYDIPFASTASLKVFAYCAGYQIAHLTNAPFTGVWDPDFRALPSTNIRGILSDTKGHPMPRESLVMTYHMMEAMPFLGYYDGGVPFLILATAETQSDGTFQMTATLLGKDPFFQQYSTETREAELSLSSVRAISRAPWILRPATIPLQEEYPAPIIIHRVTKATLNGKISRAYLATHAITGVVRGGYWPETEHGYRLELQARSKDGRSTYNCFLKENLTYSVNLPPGTYDLELLEMARGYTKHKSVIVKEAVALRENDELILSLD